MGSQSNSQWTPEHPLSWFSGLLGSSSGTPEVSELGPGEPEQVFLKREVNKEIKSLLSQPESFDLPGYCSCRDPYRTLDFLAEHRLFPALQSVVSQAVDKLSGACRLNGCPLFPSEWEHASEPSSEVTPGSKQATPTEGEELYDYSLPTTSSSLKIVHKKSHKSRGWDKPKEDCSSMSSAQEATRFKSKVTPTEESKVPSTYSRQKAPDQDTKVQRPSMSVSGTLSSSQRAQPWRSLHLTLPAPGIKVEVPSSQTHLTKVTAPLACPLPSFLPPPPCVPTTHLPGRCFFPSLPSLYLETTSSRGRRLRDVGAGFQGKGPFLAAPVTGRCPWFKSLAVHCGNHLSKGQADGGPRTLA